MGTCIVEEISVPRYRKFITWSMDYLHVVFISVYVEYVERLCRICRIFVSCSHLLINEHIIPLAHNLYFTFVHPISLTYVLYMFFYSLLNRSIMLVKKWSWKGKRNDEMSCLLDITLGLAKQNLSFRGYREGMQSENWGNLFELVEFLSNRDAL